MVNSTLRLTSVVVPWRLGFGHRQPPNFLNIHTTSQPPVSLSRASVTSVSTQWSEFAERVSGEWDGFGADFNGDDGKPIHLPEAVVPEAFREWEVEVFDWQTQCPTLATSPLLVSYKTIRLLPTVGCEADAATRHSVHPRSASSASAFAYHPSGSYVAIWPHPQQLMEVEHCLVNPLDRESRVRIVQVVEDGGSLVRVQVFREQWYGPFRDGDQLGGCAIKDSAFASSAPLDASLVVGAWEGPSSVAHFNTDKSSILELVDGGLRRSLREERGLVLLPKQIWCSVRQGQGSETCCEVGWLFNQRTAVTSRCTFTADAKLKEISVAQETATPEAA